jgi:aconitate hydratase
MGVLPLKFPEGQNADSLGLDGSEVFDIEGLDDTLRPKAEVKVNAARNDGSSIEFKATVQLNTEVEMNYFRNGGILHTVLRNLVR